MDWEKLGSITVLIADDDAFNRQLIISFLSKIPTINYIEAENGIEALEFLANEKIDIVLLDLHMPKFNGVDTIKEIKKHNAYALIPIIIITTDELVMKKLYALGADDFVSKPFKLMELQAKIYKQVENKFYKEKFHKITKDEQKNSKDEKLFNLESIENSQQEIFKGLAFIVASKDSNISMTARLVKAFAELLNYSKKDIDRLYLSAIVYNMGSLSSSHFKNSHVNIISGENSDVTPQYILQGYQVVKNSIETPFLKILKSVITQHKENFDGTGIPQQLKGEEIDPFAHIVHIVETFNLLVSQENPPESIYNFLEEQSSKWFEPKMLYHFLEYFDYFIELRKKYAK